MVVFERRGFLASLLDSSPNLAAPHFGAADFFGRTVYLALTFGWASYRTSVRSSYDGRRSPKDQSTDSVHSAPGGNVPGRGVRHGRNHQTGSGIRPKGR